MRTVWKFPLELGVTVVALPPHSLPVHVAMQDGRLHVWIELNPDASAEEEWAFQVYGTGHPIGDQMAHVGSVQDGPFVWHVYTVYTGG